MEPLAGVLVLLTSFPGHPHLQFLHTASDQDLEVGRPGSEARYCSSSVHLLKKKTKKKLVLAIVIIVIIII